MTTVCSSMRSASASGGPRARPALAREGDRAGLIGRARALAHRRPSRRGARPGAGRSSRRHAASGSARAGHDELRAGQILRRGRARPPPRRRGHPRSGRRGVGRDRPRGLRGSGGRPGRRADLDVRLARGLGRPSGAVASARRQPQRHVGAQADERRGQQAGRHRAAGQTVPAVTTAGGRPRLPARHRGAARRPGVHEAHGDRRGSRARHARGRSPRARPRRGETTRPRRRSARRRSRGAPPALRRARARRRRRPRPRSTRATAAGARRPGRRASLPRARPSWPQLQAP
jgi:hypothetical protein